LLGAGLPEAAFGEGLHMQSRGAFAVRDLFAESNFVLLDEGVLNGSSNATGADAERSSTSFWKPAAVLVFGLAVGGLGWRFRRRASTSCHLDRLGFTDDDGELDAVSSEEVSEDLIKSSASEGDGQQADRARESQEDPRSSSVPQVALLIVLWWGASIYVTLMVKLSAVGSIPHPMVKGGEPGPRHPPVLPPFLMTSLVNIVTGLCSWCIANLFFRPSKPLPEISNQEIVKIAVLGVLQGCEIGSLNKSLQYITISERTMFQNSNILLMMFCAQIFGLERLTMLRIAAGLLLVGGGVLQGLASSQQRHHAKGGTAEENHMEDIEHLRGIVFMLASMLLASSKWSLIQIMTQRNDKMSYLGQVSKVQLGATVQPITGLVCFGLALFFELDAIESSDTWHSPLLLRVPTLAVGIVIITGSELKLVQLTSAVATGVLMNLHHIPMMLVGVVIFHDQVTLYIILGFGVCLLGGFVYAAARSYDTQTVHD